MTKLVKDLKSITLEDINCVDPDLMEILSDIGKNNSGLQKIVLNQYKLASWVTTEGLIEFPSKLANVITEIAKSNGKLKELEVSRFRTLYPPEKEDVAKIEEEIKKMKSLLSKQKISVKLD